MILFNCTAGPHVGLGHLMRSSALAIALNELGIASAIYGPDDKYRTIFDNNIFVAWQPFHRKDKNGSDPFFFIDYANSLGSSLMVFDNFGISEDYYQKLSQQKFRWLQYVGEPSGRLFAHILVRSSPAAKPKDYIPLIERADCKVLMGPKYAALRPEFSNQKPKKIKNNIKSIFINFGGGNDCGGILRVLNALFNHTKEDVKFTIVSGQANPQNRELLKKMNKYTIERVKFLINPPHLASLMALCDIAIMAGGTATFEAASLGLPMLIIALNQSQEEQAKAWENLGVAIFCGKLSDINQQHVLNGFQKISALYQQKPNSMQRALNNFDGNGAMRLAEEIWRLDGNCRNW